MKLNTLVRDASSAALYRPYAAKTRALNAQWVNVLYTMSETH
jgi:hypothetical protein